MHYSETQKHILISITERCNLDCTYCFEKNSRSHDVIEVDTAIKIIENELLSPSKYQYFKIDLFGGEPFLEFDKIKKICEYIWNREWNKAYGIWTTTNGTLVHGEIKEWLIKNSERISCGLSIDGTKETHDLNRCSSFDAIDYEFFAKTWPERHARAVIYGNTVHKVYDNIIFLHEHFSHINARLAFGFDWSKDKYIDEFRKQVQKLIEFYMKHPNIEPVTFLDLNIGVISEKISHSYCGLGQCTVSYSTEGKKYPCPQFQSMCKMKDVDLQELFNAENMFGNECIGDCQKCLLKNICRTCVAENYQLFKTLKKKSKNNCEIFKEQAYGTALIKENQLRVKHNKNPHYTEEEKNLLEAIRLIKLAYEENMWFIL